TSVSNFTVVSNLMDTPFIRAHPPKTCPDRSSINPAAPDLMVLPLPKVWHHDGFLLQAGDRARPPVGHRPLRYRYVSARPAGNRQGSRLVHQRDAAQSARLLHLLRAGPTDLWSAVGHVGAQDPAL